MLDGSGTVRVRDVITGRVVAHFPTAFRSSATSPARAPMAFSPDARLLAIGSNDGHIDIRRSLAGRLVRTLPYPGKDIHDPGSPAMKFTDPQPVTAVAFAPGDTLLAATFANGVGVLWNVRTAAVVSPFWLGQAPERPIPRLVLRFTDDGQMLGVTLQIGVGIYGVPSGRPLRALLVLRSARGLAFSPRGDFVAVADTEGVFSVSSLGPGTWWAQSASNVPGTNVPSEAVGVAFSPDETRIAGVDSQGAITVWETVTGRQLVRLSVPSTEARAVIADQTDGGEAVLRVTTPIGLYVYPVPVARPLADQWRIRRAAAAESLATTPVVVVGRVVDRTTGRPIAGARTERVLSSGARIVRTAIDSSGRFALGRVRQGPMTIDVRCPSHAMLGALAYDTTVVVVPSDSIVLDLRIDGARCEEPPPGPRIMRLRGLYSFGFEESEFIPCRDTSRAFQEVWDNPLGATVWVGSIHGSPKRWPRADTSRYATGYPTWYVDWRGTLLGPGKYGMGVSSYQLNVTSVYAVRTKAPLDCRLPPNVSRRSH